MTDFLLLILSLLFAWGAYTLAGKKANERTKGILSLAYIFCILTFMEYYNGRLLGCIIILVISAVILCLRFLLHSGDKIPWTISLLAEWTFPLVLNKTLVKFTNLSSASCIGITLASVILGMSIIVCIIFKQEK